MTKRSRGNGEASHEPQRKQFVQDRLKVDPFAKMFNAARAQAQANNTKPRNSDVAGSSSAETPRCCHCGLQSAAGAAFLLGVLILDGHQLIGTYYSQLDDG